MRPIRATDSNFTFLGPTDEVADLPCRRGEGRTTSTWEFSDEERAAIAEGANLILGLWCDGHPPVSLRVDHALEIPQPGDLRCSGCDALYTEGRGLAQCGQCDGELVAQTIGS